MSYLTSITRLYKQDNLGGLLTLQIIRAADVESMGDPVESVIYGTITPKAGKAFVSWQCIIETASARSQSRSSMHGAVKNNVLPFMLPKDRSTIKAQLDQAEADEFIVLFKDANGVQKVFGTLNAPVRFEFDHNTGAQFASLNAYDCRFYYNGPDNLYHYNGALPAPATGAAPAIVKFNGTAIASLAAGETLNIISDFGFTDFYITAP